LFGDYITELGSGHDVLDRDFHFVFPGTDDCTPTVRQSQVVSVNFCKFGELGRRWPLFSGGSGSEELEVVSVHHK
jgi:hypothetical protein